MRHPNKIAILLITFTLLAFSNMSCTQPTPTPQPTDTFTALPTAELRVEPFPTPISLCHQDLIQPIRLGSPVDNTVVELSNPTFNWMDENICPFQAYQINIQYPLVDHGIDRITFTDIVPYPNLSYTFPQELQLPAGSYVTWWMSPILGQQDLPEGGSQTIYGPRSKEGHFFTGPDCVLEERVEPELFAPEDGVEIYPGLTSAGNTPEFVWLDSSACLPDSYKIQFSLNERWVIPDLEIDTESPANRWQADRMLEQGVEYFWRVASVVDGVLGPWSQPKSFTTRTLPENQFGLVHGVIFEDICDNPYPRDDFPDDYTPPDGCIIPADEEQWPYDEEVMGDGLLTHHDRGVAGVTITVCSGVCPYQQGSSCHDVISSSDPRWAGDWYSYLNPGTYCIHIYDDKPGNELFQFGKGYWTQPVSEDHLSNMKMITINQPGEVVAAVNFGWDDHGVELDTFSSVTGKVWFDMDGDGQLESGEPTLPGHQVQIAAGDCSEDWADRLIPTLESSTDGSYNASGLQPGDYCLVLTSAEWESVPGLVGPEGIIEIDINNPGLKSIQEIIEVDHNRIIEFDDSMLYSTSPQGESGAAGIPFSLETGEEKSLNIGWVNWPLVIDRDPAACRSGPGESYSTQRYYTAGDARYLIGKSFDNRYWVTTDNCWVSDILVDFYGDPAVLPATIPPPTQQPDTTPPSVSIQSIPAEPDHYSTVTLLATASDNQGVAKISIWWTPSIVWLINPSKICNNTTTCSLDIGHFDPEDTVRYYAKAWDAAENMGDSGIESFTIPPE